jgi:hypothetical protein
MEYLRSEKLTWDLTDIGELNDSSFISPLKLTDLKDDEFYSTGLFYTEEDSRQIMKVSIFNYNAKSNIQVALEKLKPEFRLASMFYLIFTYKGTKYLMSKDSGDTYTYEKIIKPYSKSYLNILRKTLAFQWLFCIRVTNEDKLLTRILDFETSYDSSHVVSCFETNYTFNPDDDIKLPRLMINKYFDKKDEYFLSTCQIVLFDAYEDENIFIQKIRDVVMESKGDIYWFNKCLVRIRYILEFKRIEPRYSEIDIKVCPESSSRTKRIEEWL